MLIHKKKGPGKEKINGTVFYPSSCYFSITRYLNEVVHRKSGVFPGEKIQGKNTVEGSFVNKMFYHLSSEHLGKL